MVRRTYTVDEAAGVLGISRSTAYECVRTGELPSLRFRRRIVIPAHALEQLIASGAAEIGGPGSGAAAPAS
jgi:excisionase family DNA binding protein